MARSFNYIFSTPLFPEDQPDDDPVLLGMVEAIINDDSEGLEELLHADEDVEKRLSTFVEGGEFRGQTLLHIAADKSRNKCVRVILAQVNTDTRKYLCNLPEKNEFGRIPLHTVLDGGCRCDNCSAKNIDCVNMLLEEGSHVNSRDKEGDTPLFYATEYMMADCASILLEYGADARLEFVPWKHRSSKKGTRGHGVPVILYKYIAQKIPSALVALLDKGITTDEKDSAFLNLDFQIFLSTNRGEDAKSNIEKETDILVCMSNAYSAGKELLLTHPLTLAFLHFKWILVRRFILIIQLSYFIMTAIYTYFVLEAFDYVLPASAYTTESPNPEAENEPENDKAIIRVLACFVCLWWIFMVLNEIYEISLGLSTYLRVSLNYAWWVLIICVGISVPPGFGLDPQLWQLPIASFAVFLAWGLTLVQTSRFPSLGIYIEMLGKVVMDFAVFLITFAALLIGFALAFHVIFPQDHMFSNLATAFVKVILIMIGETNYDQTFEEIVDPDIDMVLGLEYTIPAHIMYVGFIFVITIVLMNLLLGLAVSDIQELRKVATVLRVKRQIEQIQLFESLILGKFIPKRITEWGMRYFSIMTILNKFDLRSTTSVQICPTDPQNKTIPKELKDIFIAHQLDKPCINNPEILMTTPKKFRNEEESTQQKVQNYLGGKKRVRRLEEKMNRMQDTLLAIQEQLLLLQLK